MGGLYLTKGGEEEVISQSSSSLQNVLADRHGRDTGHCHCQVNCLFDQGRGGGIKFIIWVIILTPRRLVISDKWKNKTNRGIKRCDSIRDPYGLKYFIIYLINYLCLDSILQIKYWTTIADILAR